MPVPDEGYFEIGPTSEIATAWFVAWPGMDWMAMVFRDGPEAPWRSVWRFRYVVDDKDPWESEDRKSGYQLTCRPDEESRLKLIRHIGDTAEMIKTTRSGKLWRVDVNGDAEAFISAWSKLPFTHARVPSPEPDRVQ